MVYLKEPGCQNYFKNISNFKFIGQDHIQFDITHSYHRGIFTQY